ncbi:S26 family signal peptidase [uncultured Roseobacter sp.]|uniref:S26 family signal peptidase n=1 Tax=uncultured Roseobacter sp. TaxID=114847 RepID=UPI00260550EA|nr:S26 family signal peptidase [uncultured Roseobacter sp.]
MKGIWLIGIAVPILLLGVASVILLPRKLIYNPSESAPVGFYWIDQKPVRRGDFVVVRVPLSLRDLVETRGYLPPDVPLLKRVMALPGDEVCRRGQDITVNGGAVAMAQTRDRSGRDMPRWHGCQMLDGEDIFVLQDHPQSFDGRYFGPLNRCLIIGRARLLRFPRRNDGKW